MTNINTTEVQVEAKAEMTNEAYSKMMEELANNPNVTDIKVTEGSDEVLPV